ncbi:maleylpyruvate isomerase family mycothiol-dependent enzyme [Amycolatopsis sp., V23-08]|uniref:Maleylpyruvate isomerase family mycothiol-dependent enzyme n=1 Tax=Amycolatopsis heterodermiae TaxID=3110235 RepID=A0ABU5RG97_9PSEU|nr:maleylpyruvate isomerase family mycothiol-dependent enzyme [Amycolatopsis sp., V23-08]MEA5364769.1 maleylpyruvate isomerase family mycothiol-dependent enzyme [Amycolatopsis sp., V23-08]
MSPEHALVDQGRLLTALESEGEVLVEAVRAAPLEAPVPACPGWSLGEVARHVGSRYRMVRRRLVEGRSPDEWQRDPEPGQSLARYLETGLAELLGELAAHDPAEPADTWWPADPTYGFWRRRMVHETVVHRVDVEQAAGVEEREVSEDLALDGVDEALILWFGQKLPLLGLTGTKAGSVGVKAGGHSWIARAGPETTEAWRCSAAEAEEADDVVTAEPWRIYLWLWGRASLTSVTVRGVHDQAAQLWALLRLATR